MGSFSKYVDEGKKKAQGKNRKPFILRDLPDKPDKPIVIEFPDAPTQMRYEEAQSLPQQLRVLMGVRNYARLLDNLKGEPGEAAEAILTDMWDQWGEDDSDEVPGGKEQ